MTPGDPFSARVASAPAERAKRRKLEPYSSLVVAASREWDSGTMAQWHNGIMVHWKRPEGFQVAQSHGSAAD